MSFVSILLSIFLIVLLPVLAGCGWVCGDKGFVSDGLKNCNGCRKAVGFFLWSWLFGQLLLWCAFQIVSVLSILKDKTFPFITKIYIPAVAVITLASLMVYIFKMVRKETIFNIKTEKIEKSKLMSALWIVFFVLLIVQVALQICLAYMDGDDTYYVAQSVSSGLGGTLYSSVPYTGEKMVMDYRHSLEPFPLWITFISKISGMNITVMSHTVLPALFVPLTYGLYALFGARLLKGKEKYLPVFMIIIELLNVFGAYSSKTPEKFFITRIRQGKSTLASIVIPMIIMCLFIILEYVKENAGIDVKLWILLVLLNVAGCLCSTLGAVLCAAPVMVVALLIGIMYKKWKYVLPMFAGCIPCIVFAVMYLLLG